METTQEGSLSEQLLALLSHESSADEFEQSLDALGEHEAEDSSTRRQFHAARQVRALLERYSRRAGELAVLYDTAGDLSSLRDLETVLRSIVRRGRQLLRTDVAYLMLIDDQRHDTYMRVAEGTVSPNFMDVRLELGVGLGGLVAQTAAPQWTASYLMDQGYRHVVDDVVREESLVSVLGVPLKIGRRILGVLFAADRRPRSFAQEEVSLLSSLADHAAIAIENASLFQETREAVDRLSRAKSVIERHSMSLEQAAALHERLIVSILSGGDDQDIADAVAHSVRCPVTILNSDAKVIAHSGEQGAGEWQGAGWQELFQEASRSRRIASASVDGTRCYAVAVRAGDEPFGWLIVTGRELDEADSRSLEGAAMVTALVRLNERARDEAESRVRGELLAELLAERVRDESSLVRRADLMGVDLTAPLTVVVAQPADGSSLARVRADASSLARELRGLVTTQNESVVVLLPSDDPVSMSRVVARLVNRDRHNKATLGAAGPVTALSEVSKCADQAARCARLLGTLGRAGDAAAVQELGLYGLLLSDAGRDQVNAFVESTLGPLERYDSERRTVLVETADAYFDHDGNVARAAQAMFIHTNTMYQRLERIDTILGCSWRAGDGAMEVRLALRLRRFAVG